MPIVSSIEFPIEADVLATTDRPLLKSPVDTEKLFAFILDLIRYIKPNLLQFAYIFI